MRPLVGRLATGELQVRKDCILRAITMVVGQLSAATADRIRIAVAMASDASPGAIRFGLVVLACLAMPAAGCVAANPAAGAPQVVNAPPDVSIPPSVYGPQASGQAQLPPAESIPPGIAPTPGGTVMVPPTGVSPAPSCWLFRCFRKLDACGLSRQPPGYRPAPLMANEG